MKDKKAYCEARKEDDTPCTYDNCPHRLPATEEEANGYLMLRQQKTKVKSSTISFVPGGFLLRVTRNHGPWKLGSMNISPPYSWDVGGTVLVGRMWIRRASVGHLRLYGPAKKGRMRAALALFISDQEDKKLFSKLTSVKFEQNKMSLTVGNE